MRRRTWIIIGVVVVVLIVGAIALAGRSSAPTKVETTKTERGPISEVVTASGVVTPDRILPVVNETTAKVEKVLVKEGSRVNKDQKVVRFEWGSDAESPIKGRVVKISATVGVASAPGAVLMQVADMRPTFVIAKVDETDISKVKRGQPVRVWLDAYPKKKVRGRVVSIGSQSAVTEGGGTAFPVKIRLVKKPKHVTLRLGMNADVDIVVKVHRDAVLLPVEAVTSANQEDTVYIIEDGTVEAQKVTLGISSDTYYEVIGGIAAGDEVATTNLDKLTDGMKVQVAE